MEPKTNYLALKLYTGPPNCELGPPNLRVGGARASGSATAGTANKLASHQSRIYFGKLRLLCERSSIINQSSNL